MDKHSFTLKGQLPAKKNAWKVGRYGIYQSKSKEIDVFIFQLKEQVRQYPDLPLLKDCKIEVVLHQSNRTDLDGQITTLCDILQTSGVVKNDRQIKNIVAQKIVDNKNPRVEVNIF